MALGRPTAEFPQRTFFKICDKQKVYHNVHIFIIASRNKLLLLWSKDKDTARPVSLDGISASARGVVEYKLTGGLYTTTTFCETVMLWLRVLAEIR